MFFTPAKSYDTMTTFEQNCMPVPHPSLPLSVTPFLSINNIPIIFSNDWNMGIRGGLCFTGLAIAKYFERHAKSVMDNLIGLGRVKCSGNNKTDKQHCIKIMMDVPTTYNNNLEREKRQCSIIRSTTLYFLISHNTHSREKIHNGNIIVKSSQNNIVKILCNSILFTIYNGSKQ